MPNCAVSGCKSSSKRKSINVMFHSFPKDENIKQKWVKFCNRNGTWNPNSSRICSLHFNSSDYARDLQAELTGQVRRKILKPYSYPQFSLQKGNIIIEETSNLKGSSNQQPNGSLIKGNTIIRKKPSKVNALDKKNKNFEVPKQGRKHTDVIFDSNINQVSSKNIIMQCQMQNGLQKNPPTMKLVTPEKSNALLLLCKALPVQKEELKVTKKRVSTTNQTGQALYSLQHQVSILKQQVENLKNDKAKLTSRWRASELRLRELKRVHNECSKYCTKYTEKILSKVFTPKQIQSLMKGRVTWESEDVKMAQTLRSMVSREAYNYLKTKMPLPSLVTLRTWKRTKNLSGLEGKASNVQISENTKLGDKIIKEHSYVGSPRSPRKS